VKYIETLERREMLIMFLIVGVIAQHILQPENHLQPEVEDEPGVASPTSLGIISDGQLQAPSGTPRRSRSSAQQLDPNFDN
jgi:hypothetical protein